MTEIREPQLFGASVESDTAIVTFDATLAESWRDESSVTEHPVEDGSIISDHVELEPESVELTALLTDSPTTFPAEQGRAIGLFDALNAMRLNRQLVTVIVELRVFENMIMTRCNYTAAVPAETAMGIELAFRQIEIVAPELVFIPGDQVVVTEDENGNSDGADDRAASEEDRGPQGTVTPEEQERLRAAEAMCANASASERMMADDLKELCSDGPVNEQFIRNILTATEYTATPYIEGVEAGFSSF